MNCHMACRSVVGKVRTNNEDNFYFYGQYLAPTSFGTKQTIVSRDSLDKSLCFAVFDGMGGEAYGEEASLAAAQTFDKMVRQSAGSPLDLQAACLAANEAVCACARRRNVGLVGSTVVALQLYGHTAELMNLGDSRAFLLRGGVLRQLSVDHTEADMMKQFGITGRKPRLTQHLGIEPSEMVVEPHIVSIDVQHGDRFLLCSDGLTDMVSESEIRAILEVASSPQSAVESLIERAMAYGGRDNTTVICCELNNSDHEER